MRGGPAWVREGAPTEHQGQKKDPKPPCGPRPHHFVVRQGGARYCGAGNPEALTLPLRTKRTRFLMECVSVRWRCGAHARVCVCVWLCVCVCGVVSGAWCPVCACGHPKYPRHLAPETTCTRHHTHHIPDTVRQTPHPRHHTRDIAHTSPQTSKQANKNKQNTNT